MNKRLRVKEIDTFNKGFTLIELLVVIAIIALLLSIILPSIQMAKEKGKRIVCLSDLKQLTICSLMYSDENDDKIVSAMAGIYRHGLPPWVGVCWSDSWGTGEPLLPLSLQEDAIIDGALWQYTDSVDMYKCPTGYRNEMLTYAMSLAMNGRDDLTTSDGKLWPVFKKQGQVPMPSARMVFLDEGYASPSNWSVQYGKPRWWDEPATRHSDGNNFSFADGHSEYHKWTAAATRERGHKTDRRFIGNWVPDPGDELAQNDLQWVQRAMWGELGYIPQ